MVYPLKLHHGPGVNYTVIGEKVMATGKKDRPWDGRSRPSDDLYRKEFDRIFKKEKTLHEELMEGYEEEKKLNDE
jgi:hypothetical protein